MRIDGISVYVDGTTEATLKKVARNFRFRAHVLRADPEVTSELDVLFERPAFAVSDSVRDGRALLEELAGSGVRLRAPVAFCSSVYARDVRAAFAGLEDEPTVEHKVSIDTRD